MTLQQAIKRLLALRDELPEDGANADRARAALDELKRARSRNRKQLLTAKAIDLMLQIPLVREAALNIAENVNLPRMLSPGKNFHELIISDVDTELETRGRRTPDREIRAVGRARGPLRGIRVSAPAVPARTRSTSTPTPRVIERTPHLQLDKPQAIALGENLKPAVYLDTKQAQPGEHAENLRLPALQRMTVGVTLTASPHFRINGSPHAEITVRAAQPQSESAVFDVDCVKAAAGTPGLAATFTYQWRPVGSIWRELKVKGARKAAHRPVKPPAGSAAIDPAARPPDLLVQIIQHPDGDERHYDLTVRSPHLRAYRDGVSGPWRLRERTKDFVEGYMDAFTTSDPGGRKASLLGAGRDLFTITPAIFKDALFQLIAAGKLQSIFVVTSEPFIPWELMVPNDGVVTRPPLGVEFSVGRWVDPRHLSPPQLMPIESSYVIAPKYRAGNRLASSASETQLVLNAFNGKQISPARLKNIDATLAAEGASLLHLICHGSDSQGGQILDLDPDERLREIQLAGLEGLAHAVTADRPFVFINACQVGRTTPSLVGSGGFAARFTELGARCVIAPIWSVKDSVAMTVARTFYERAHAEPFTPFATILRDIRKLAYDGEDPEDSYAAYCFYGDPLAAQATDPQAQHTTTRKTR
jgi:hypothetical protein